MTTTTARYALTKIQLSDNVDVVADFNNNWDSLDQKLGTQVCTSSTRPSSPVQGLEIYETDTGATRTYSGAAWQPSALMIATSASRPANPITGDTIYETDTGAIAVFVGGGIWRYRNVYNCTSATRPTAVASGATIYETDTKRLLTYNGSAWENKAFSNFICTSATHPGSPFQGLEIYETDTNLSAVYTGSAYSYPMQQLASSTVAVAAPSVTLAVPAGFSWLELFWRARATDAVTAEQLWLQFNGDSGSNYLWEVDQANNATVAGTTSGAATTKIQIGTIPSASATALYFGSGKVEISGASDTTNFKNVSGHANAASSPTNMYSGTYGGQWNSTAAITSITILSNAGNLAVGSTFSVVGFK